MSWVVGVDVGVGVGRGCGSWVWVNVVGKKKIPKKKLKNKIAIPRVLFLLPAVTKQISECFTWGGYLGHF